MKWIRYNKIEEHFNPSRFTVILSKNKIYVAISKLKHFGWLFDVRTMREWAWWKRRRKESGEKRKGRGRDIYGLLSLKDHWTGQLDMMKVSIAVFEIIELSWNGRMNIKKMFLLSNVFDRLFCFVPLFPSFKLMQVSNILLENSIST